MIQKMLNQEHHVLQVQFSPNQTVTIQVCVSVCVCWRDRLKAIKFSRVFQDGAMRSRSSETEDGAAGAAPREQTAASGANSCNEETANACSVSDVISLRGTSAYPGPEGLHLCQAVEARLKACISRELEPTWSSSGRATCFPKFYRCDKE